LARSDDGDVAAMSCERAWCMRRLRQAPEILVFGQHDSLVGVRAREDFIVADARSGLEDAENVMTGIAKSARDASIEALISEQAHD